MAVSHETKINSPDPSRRQRVRRPPFLPFFHPPIKLASFHHVAVSTWIGGTDRSALGHAPRPPFRERTALTGDDVIPLARPPVGAFVRSTFRVQGSPFKNSPTDKSNCLINSSTLSSAVT